MIKLAGGHKFFLIFIIYLTLIFSKNISAVQIFDYHTEKFINKINSDILTNLNFNKFFEEFKNSNADMSVVGVGHNIEVPYAVIESENDIVKSFKEKPILNDSINIGYFYFNSSMRDLINRKKKLISVINQLVQDKHLRAYKHKGIHITINTLAELDYAKKNISKIYK